MGTTGDIARQQIEAGCTGDWDRLRELYAEDVEYVDPEGALKGAEAAVAHLQVQTEPFPDGLKVEIVAVYEGDDHAVAEWKGRAKNTGPLAMPDGTTLPATGRDVELAVVTLYDISDGTITSERNYWDNLGLYAQLGLLPE